MPGGGVRMSRLHASLCRLRWGGRPSLMGIKSGVYSIGKRGFQAIYQSATRLGERLGWDWLTYNYGTYLSFHRAAKKFGPGFSDVVLQVFNEALALRKSKGESVERTFVGVRSADIVDAGMEGGAAWIDGRFVGEMVSVTRDRLGGLLAGEPGRVVDVTDIWTFERELRSAQPHWQLIHTDSDE